MEQKVKYIKDHSKPSKNSRLCTQTVNRTNQGRSYELAFQTQWLEQFAWLEYSSVLGGGICKYCVLFPPKNTKICTGVLVSTPLTNLKKATGKDGLLVRHSTFDYHKQAVSAGCELVHALNNPTQTIPYQMSCENQQIYDKNLHILKSIVGVVLLCGKQNIALRGHRDDNTEKCSGTCNKGNFLAILNHIASSDLVLRDHLENGKRNSRYTSKTIQNEIIEIIGDNIRRRLTECLQADDSFFTIMGDEVTDSHGNQEVLAVCLRFLDTIKTPPGVKEVFFDFIYLDRTTGESISNAIVDCLFRRGIDIRKARGQSYDGASCMSSARVGVQGRIKELAPRAVYTHCNCHVLNLSIAAACKVPAIRNMIDSVNEIFKFFDYSPKRQRYLEEILDEKEDSPSQKMTSHGTGIVTPESQHKACFQL
ncbi:PREDICTED: 52 kDa repressor of the inhibitor of the protein kinase-like [Priapulus caudatus]|uniref:52 kDa repressor of the inhibitor of the protein kinase-like n=1 Tax=Priapulus caudatus TaxID=37621 RepID=A0ABM1EIA6_PRICU|nr:PREDICTED: 52 kDa repressor of the inhibitor of the protein kinase-like [Priapulus caudatus]